MQTVARVFDAQNTGSTQHTPVPPGTASWEATAANQMPPMMLQLRRHDGSMISFSYSDVREVHASHAGLVELYLVAMRKTLVRIEGRRLTELANLITAGMVRWVQEADPRDYDLPEESPAVLSITIKALGE